MFISSSDVAPATLARLDLLLRQLFASEVKDRAWLDMVLDFIDTNPYLHELGFMRRTLHLHACALFNESVNMKPSKPDSALYVMFSAARGVVKVGRTASDCAVRAAQLRVACPDIEVVKSFHGAGYLEPAVHKALAGFCVGGEWFSLRPHVVVALITQMLVDSGHSQPLTPSDTDPAV